MEMLCTQRVADTYSSAAQKRAVPVPLLLHDTPDSANTADPASAAAPYCPTANEYLRTHASTKSSHLCALRLIAPRLPGLLINHMQLTSAVDTHEPLAVFWKPPPTVE